jgi:hypothetical protein
MEKKIYVAVAAQVGYPKINQPAGRQIAQVAHAVSMLRHKLAVLAEFDIPEKFEPITTIVLQARDNHELYHIHLLATGKQLTYVSFFDTNPKAYEGMEHNTAVAIYATEREVYGVTDYLPLWGAE